MSITVLIMQCSGFILYMHAQRVKEFVLDIDRVRI